MITGYKTVYDQASRTHSGYKLVRIHSLVTDHGKGKTYKIRVTVDCQPSYAIQSQACVELLSDINTWTFLVDEEPTTWHEIARTRRCKTDGDISDILSPVATRLYKAAFDILS